MFSKPLGHISVEFFLDSTAFFMMTNMNKRFLDILKKMNIILLLNFSQKMLLFLFKIYNTIMWLMYGWIPKNTTEFAVWIKLNIFRRI